MTDFFKKLAAHSLIYYSVCVIIYLTVILLSGGEQPFAYRLLMLFLFAFFFALANCIFMQKKYAFGTRIVFHYIFTMLGLYLGTVLPTVIGNHIQARTAIIMMVLYGIVYAAAMIPICIADSKRSKSKNSKKEYSSIFEKRK